MGDTRIGIVGCGDISEAHIRSYKKLRDVKLVAFCDSDEGRARKKAEELGGSYYADYHDMFDKERLDGISISTPPSTHRDIALPALKSNINVLCEKPLSINTKDGQDIVRAEKESKAFLMLAFKFRFCYAFNQAKKLLDDGALGKVVLFRNMFGGFTDMARRGWFAKREIAGGGVLMDNGVHAVDIFRYLFGEIRGVYAVLAKAVQDIEVEDTARLVVDMQSGILGSSDLSWSVAIPDEFFFEIYGSAGSMFVNADKVRYKAGIESEWQEIDGAGEKGMFEREVEHFINCIRSEEDLLVDARDGLRVQEVIAAGYQSAKEGRYIELSERSR